MAKTKKPKNAQKPKRGGAQSAESFLKNGSKNAAKALKKNAKQIVHQAAKPLRVEPPRRKPYRVKQPHRFHGTADPTLVVKDAVAKSKHQTYYEIVDNTEKKKKLEFQVTHKWDPPPGFTFIPVGNPELTHACKELSREQDCMIFVVSETGEHTDFLSDHTNRLGYHFRSTIVDEASATVEVQSVRRRGVNTLQSSSRRPHNYNNNNNNNSNKKEKYPLPATQEEIDAEADAVIRDLFPRIPNTDRQEIINHAFQLGRTFAGKPVVGLQEDVPLHRRVQLAVLAHIRHTHTRYDKLLRETDWATARATIEASCLEIIVKWRGDEETGRDQMDEVLREVVIISDSEDTDTEDTYDDEDEELEEGEVAEAEVDSDVEMANSEPSSVSSNQQARENGPSQHESTSLLPPPRRATAEVGLGASMASRHGVHAMKTRTSKDQRNERKGFKRYQAWNEAISRHQKNPDTSPQTRAQDQNRQTAIHSAGLYGHSQPHLSSYPGHTQRHAPGQEPRLQTTSHQATFHAGEVIDLTESPYREKVMSRPVFETSSHFQPFEQRESRYGRYEDPPQGQHKLVIKERAPSGPQPISPLKSGLQDYLLPSIEEAPDRALGDRRVPDLSRQSEVRPQLADPFSRGLTLISDGTYRDSHGLIRTADGRRVIYIDENNQEIPRSLDLSRGFAGNYGESSTTRTLSLASGNSSMRYYHDSVTLDGHPRSKLNTVSTTGHARGEFYTGRLENRPYGDLQDRNGIRHQSSLKLHPESPLVEHHGSSVSSQQGVIPREPESYRPRLRDVAENYGRGPGEVSHVVRPESLSRFSEKNYGVARPEPISHPSSQLRESVVYGQGEFENPVLVSHRTGGAMHYLEVPSLASRSYYEDTPRRPNSAAQHSTSRRPAIEYIDLDRPVIDYRRSTQDQYASRSGADVRPDVIPLDQTRTHAHERTPSHNTRPPAARYDYVH